MILPGDAAQSIAAAEKSIRSGGLLGLPTETVYGLAADADNDAAVAKIFKAKGRPADHPLIVHVADVSAVAHYVAEVPEFAKRLMTAFWPGPLTFILPRRPGVANAASGGNPTIGLRCPSHPVAQALLQALLYGGQIPTISEQDTSVAQTPDSKQLESDPRCFKVWGLAAPSANQFGRVSPTTASHVQGEFGEELLILDGGPCEVGIESTIIDCSRGAPVLLRPGAITPEQVQASCGLKVLSKEDMQKLDTPAPKASGTLESHYAPSATVRIMTAKELQTALKLLGQDTGLKGASPTIALYCRCMFPIKTPHVLYRRMPVDAAAAAQELFAVLREFDERGVKLIWVESLPETQEWDGVRDRLERAAG
ncbi:MAG: threonylcarbamoyl-AMP synthase [Rhodoferax sp.]|nr:threonylcarbamoyl-AMP synthase [Rhodoferax sp.]